MNPKMNGPDPVFIFSLPRAGSTLLQRLLAGHPQISTTSELWFLLPFVFTLKSRGVFAKYSHVSLSNAMSDLLAQLPNGKMDYLEELGSFAQGVYSRLSETGAKYFLDKTPRYYLIIHEISQMFPNAKFIFLFRHPLATLASMIDTFWDGRLGDYRHRIDILQGPSLLAAGYEKLKTRSIVVHYEDLLLEAEKTMVSICNYLEIPYESRLIAGFNDVRLPGQMGDRIGTRDYRTLDEEPLEKWKRTFNTRFRKKWALKYLEVIGQDTLEAFGYKKQWIEKELMQIPSIAKGGVVDRYYLIKGLLFTFFEIPMFKMKIKDADSRKQIHF